MPENYEYIGSSPADEDCAQVGAANYFELSKLELAAYQTAIINKCGEPPAGARLGIKEREIVVFWDEAKPQARAWAMKVIDDGPMTWEEGGVKKPRLDDEGFTTTELIAVPEKGKSWAGPTDGLICQLYDTSLKAHGCVNAIGNEFIDGSVKGHGSWAVMCPACFGLNGVGVGLGMGQRYKKATDQKFYKVEG